jgi:hypothetical protein
MMKEICARCLQPLRDPASGKTKFVFACSDPNLPLELVDLEALEERLAQNGVHEKLTAQWVARCLAALGHAVAG